MIRASRKPRDDNGFALVYTLLVIMMVTIAVTALLTVTTGNIGQARTDQNAQAAVAAARAGVDDAEAYLESVDICRSTTRVCSQALGADSATLTRPALAAMAASVRWTTDPSLTPDGYVRVRSTATAYGVTRTVVGDLALAPSILSFGYYSDYESQSPAALADISPARAIYFDSSNYTQYLNVRDSSGRSASTSSPQTASWAGVTASTAGICGQHWWNDGSTTGRGNAYGSAGGVGSAAYSETATLSATSSRTFSRGGTCDVTFTSGQTFDGPVYTRDAMWISNGSGTGPLFKQDVRTGWGYADHTNPAPNAQGWLGDVPGSSSKTPAVARFDLQLPTDIGTQGLAANACVYYGPTRVVLNSDGTSTVTSPRTTTANAASDTACYPTVIPSTGLSRFVVPATAGGGTLLARTLGSAPTGTATWPTTGTKSTIAASTGNSVFYQTAASATAVDQPNTSVPSAWTGKWTRNPASTTCSAAAADGTDQKRFECDLGSTATFASFQTSVQQALAASTCMTSTPANQPACVVGIVQAKLPKPSGVTYTATASATPAYSTTTTTQNVGTAPTAPQAGDGLFVNTNGTVSQETATATAVPITVTRQVGSGTKVAQFTLTATQTTWAMASVGNPATSWFPNTADVTPYAASTGTNAPGDLYVEGTNHGKHSLLADNDVVVTNNVVDVTTNTDIDAVNIVAGADIRNYNPVSCLSTAVAASIANTAAGFCPNDLTGLTTSNLTSNGTLTAAHPAKQYVNLNSPADREIDGALFALTGSLRSDNFNRGVRMGNLVIKGGLYQSHRGANGQTVGVSGGSGTTQLGYFLNYTYIDLRKAALPYEPTTRTQTGRVWSVVSISANGPS